MAECTSVPTFIWNATNFIENTALRQEGIYRLSPAMDQFNEMAKQLEEHPDLAFPKDTNPNIIALLIKRFLRELPEPLIPLNNYDELLTAASLTDQTASNRAMLAAIKKMPMANRNLILVLFTHLALIEKNSDANRMGVTNLSSLFDPCIFRSPDSSRQR